MVFSTTMKKQLDRIENCHLRGAGPRHLLELPPMVINNQDPKQTAFTVSVDVKVCSRRSAKPNRMARRRLAGAC